jgi:hypothetical protein
MSEPEIEGKNRHAVDVLLVLMLVLTVGLIGIAGYFLSENRTALTPSQAASTVATSLKNHGSTAISFHIGLVKDRSDESAWDPRYRMLEKVGVITIGESQGSGAPVSLTVEGKKLLKQIPGVKRLEEADGTVAYTIPLAEMKLVQITNVATSRPGRATVEFTWRWAPNVLGERFDASGTDVRTFSSEERMELMDKYGARFYRQAPETAVVALEKSPQGWRLAND